jgi:phytoene dehydrogenase-like protein
VRDPTLYVSVPDDPAVAPADHEAWFVLVNAPRQGQGDVDWDEPGLPERYADALTALLAQRGLDLRDRVLFREIITPSDLERRTRATGGAIYGTSSNGPRAAFLRPANRSPVPGLFLVGGSSHPGGGLPLVVLSARIVSDLVGPA